MIRRLERGFAHPHVEAIVRGSRTDSLEEAAKRIAREPRRANDVFDHLLGVEPAAFPAAEAHEIRAFLPASVPALPRLFPNIEYFAGPRFRASEVSRFIRLPVGDDLSSATEHDGRRLLSVLRQPLLLAHSVVISNPLSPVLEAVPPPGHPYIGELSVDPSVIEGYIRLLTPLEPFLREGVLQLVDDRHNWSLQTSTDERVWAPASAIADAAGGLYLHDLRRAWRDEDGVGDRENLQRIAAIERTVDAVLQLAVAAFSRSVSPLTVTARPWHGKDPFLHGRPASLHRAEELLVQLFENDIVDLDDNELRYTIAQALANARPLECLSSVELPRLNMLTDIDILWIRRNDEVWSKWRSQLTSALDRASAVGELVGNEMAARSLREGMQDAAEQLRSDVIGNPSMRKRLSKIGGALATGATSGALKGLMTGVDLKMVVAGGAVGSGVAAATAIEAARRWRAHGTRHARTAIEHSLVVVTSL